MRSDVLLYNVIQKSEPQDPMHIKKIRVLNFRSIESVEIDAGAFNVLVGQNNHGKTNFFEAIKWFSSSYDRGIKRENLISAHLRDTPDAEMSVEIIFGGLQDAIANMTSATKQKALKNIFEASDEITIRRSTASEAGAKRELWNPQKKAWENIMGADNTWHEILPRLEYVHTKIVLDDVGAYKTKTPIAEMLSGVLESLIGQNEQYQELKKKFKELFGDKDSEVRIELNKLSSKVKIYLEKQFPDSASVEFNIEIPEFNDLLKRFSLEVDDGVKTLIQEKGDGMQRAMMLAIIRAYADFRKANDIAKKFLFLIDEAELHLHPSAQRALKQALLEISRGDEQVFINTHSSVFIADTEVSQRIFKVEKNGRSTQIQPLDTPDDRMEVVFELLGGSPADLLLPRNFIIVEGRSEFCFLQEIRNKFYKDKYQGIKILFARGDMERESKTFEHIHEVYKPLFVDHGIYKKKTIIICDKPNESNQRHFDAFISAHPWIEEEKQIYQLPTHSLEEYYPGKFKKDSTGVSELGKERQKVEYAKLVALQITKEQFENEMPVLYTALEVAESKSFRC